MRRKLSIACLFCAWFCANGVVWNGVQVVGWAKMFYGNAQVMNLTQALTVTFDGSAPCNLCHISQAAEDAAKQQLPQDAALSGGSEKILLIAECVPAPVLVAPEVSWPGSVNAAGLTRTEAVPVTPPRV